MVTGDRSWLRLMGHGYGWSVSVPVGVFAELVQDGQGEGGCLARTSFRAPQHVFAFQDLRNPPPTVRRVSKWGGGGGGEEGVTMRGVNEMLA